MKLAKTPTIDDLISGCKAGYRQAQEQLYLQSAPKMFAVCMRYARDRMEAEDILQTGYIKVFQKVGEFKGEGSFEGWIRRVMVNTAIESYRKNQRSLNIVQIDEAVEQLGGADSFQDFSGMGMQDLLKLIQKLADGYRVVFNMYVIEGYSHKEIAETLGITESTSKSQLSRARAILQQEIIKMEGFGYATNVG
jgi:RNA polymerase sigma factor (sigma-70 family)